MCGDLLASRKCLRAMFGITASLLAFAVSVPAVAADEAGAAAPAPAARASFVEAGDVLVRGRVIVVAPDEDSSTTVAGGQVAVDNDTVPELDISYFFTNNIAAELILGTSKHELDGKGALAGTPIGSAWIVPATLTVQYHHPLDGVLKPYVGAGINYSFFWNEDPSASFNSLEMDGGFGFALQAGVDYQISDRWFLNADLKKIFLNVDASLNNGATRADVDLDPWVFGLGVGYRF